MNNFLWVITTIVCSILGLVISIKILRRSKLAWLTMILACIGSLIIFYDDISRFSDPFFFKILTFPSSEANVISGNTFTLNGYFNKKRTFEINGLSNWWSNNDYMDSCKKLSDLFSKNKTLRLKFNDNIIFTTEPLIVDVEFNGEDIKKVLKKKNEIEQNKIISHNAHAIKSSNKNKGTKLPNSARWIIWILLGFPASVSIGMLLNNRPGGGGIALIIAFFAVRSIFNALESGDSFYPPIVCLVMMMLLAGAGKRANTEFLEKENRQ